MVDPVARLLEIVTGADVRRDLSDAEVELVVLQMQTSFAAGDLVDGLTRGITHAGRARHAAEHPARGRLSLLVSLRYLVKPALTSRSNAR